MWVRCRRSCSAPTRPPPAVPKPRHRWHAALAAGVLRCRVGVCVGAARVPCTGHRHHLRLSPFMLVYFPLLLRRRRARVFLAFSFLSEHVYLLLMVPEETLPEFMSKATRTAVNWVQMVGMKVDPLTHQVVTLVVQKFWVRASLISWYRLSRFLVLRLMRRYHA